MFQQNGSSKQGVFLLVIQIVPRRRETKWLNQQKFTDDFAHYLRPHFLYFKPVILIDNHPFEFLSTPVW